MISLQNQRKNAFIFRRSFFICTHFSFRGLYWIPPLKLTIEFKKVIRANLLDKHSHKSSIMMLQACCILICRVKYNPWPLTSDCVETWHCYSSCDISNRVIFFPVLARVLLFLFAFFCNIDNEAFSNNRNATKTSC